MYKFIVGSLFFFISIKAQEFEKLLFQQPYKKIPHAITYKLENWRRLGDNITTFCKAASISYLYKIPLLYKPFSYSDQFIVHQQQTHLSPEIENKFRKTIAIDNIDQIKEHLDSTQPILFECHFLTIMPWLYTFSREHPDFEAHIKKLFTPITPVTPLPKPQSVITVALHVRKGGGYDRPLGSQQEYYPNDKQCKGIYLYKNTPGNSCTDIWPISWPAGAMYFEAIQQLIFKKNNFSDYIWPIKFPPDQYYIDQLKELAQMLPGKNLLVYLFTDDPNPTGIMDRYSKALEDFPRIIFSYRQSDNHHTKNVLDDLFAMAQCDCLISASSSFAFIAQMLGNHTIIIFPVHAVTLPDKIFINKVGILNVQNSSNSTKRTLSYNEKTYKIRGH